MKRVKTMLRIATAFILLFGLSCKQSKQKSYKPGSTGAINSLTVVVDNELWKGEVGDKIREHFAAPCVGQPQDEPLFSIHQLPRQVFSGSVRHSRSILYVEKDSQNTAHVKKDEFARPQQVAVVTGRNVGEIVKEIDAKADAFISAFKTLEIEESQKRFTRSLSKETVFQDRLGIGMSVPSVYRVGKEEDNFVWADRQISKGNMNLVAYTLPKGTFANDSTLVRDIVRVRDSIGALYIPGPEVEGKITHMRTEPAYAPAVFTTRVNGMEAIEVRGIWDIKNYPMAGPFLTYIVKDPEDGRLLVVEGFVFAPATNKRDSMFELEAILKTLKAVSRKNRALPQ
ncbi:MAG: DUF4837 family protein [Flavobacteriaceae bacterium]